MPSAHLARAAAKVNVLKTVKAKLT